MVSQKEVQYVKELKQKKFRQQNRAFVMEGKRLVQELLNQSGPFPLQALYYSKDLSDIVVPPTVDPQIIKKATPTQMERKSSHTTPSGILAVVGMPEETVLPTEKGNLYLALDGINDPGNFGTLIRLADWFNIKAVYASLDSVELYNPKTVQATMGAILRVPVYYMDLFALFWDTSLPTIGTVLQGGSNIYTTDLPDEGIVVLGSESHGIRTDLYDCLSMRLYIPSYRQGSESLNVATAAAVICAAFRRNSPSVPRT